MSSPICHKRELVADFLEDPVPTTSPTKATGSPDSSSLLIVPIGSLKSVFFSIDKACKGISGLDQASGPGERSSVLISPSTFRTLAVIHSGTTGLFKNHSASAQDEMTLLALLFIFESSKTSWKASKINKVFVKASAATSPTSSLSKRAIKG